MRVAGGDWVRYVAGGRASPVGLFSAVSAVGLRVLDTTHHRGTAFVLVAASTTRVSSRCLQL